MTRFAFDGFLKGRQVHDHAYDIEDFEHDVSVVRELEDGVPLRRP